jgi:hypothetical protein
MSNPLFDLSTNLVRVMQPTSGLRGNPIWGNPDAMSKSLARVRKHFDSPLIKSDRRSVSTAVTKYRHSGVVADYLETKYVCIGISEDFSGWSVLQDERLLQVLLKAAAEAPERLRLRYLVCLLLSYWSFPLFSENTTKPAQKGWLILREWLKKQTSMLQSSEIKKPLWFLTLNQNSNLLGEDPCKPYEKDLLVGESSRLNEAVINLGVPANSWLLQEAALAQIKAGTALNDSGFKSHLSRLISMACGETDLKISRILSIRCIATLVSRYARCSEKPEQMALRDAAIALIGNPWLHRAAWDSHVLKSDGKPDVEARQMLNAWLKVRLIKDFFDLLSEDHSADGRRLNYWLRFEPLIEDMWFVLGADAAADKRNDYAEFRQRAKGRLLDLVGTTPPENNAFLMQIGEYLIVEFGLVGNACFVYRYDSLSDDIKRRLRSEVYKAQIDIAYLKVSGHKPRLLHQGAWERRFDNEICPLIRSWPPTRSSKTSALNTASPNRVVVVNKATARSSHLDIPVFDKVISRFGLQVNDLRSKGGCFWVLTDDRNPTICYQLKGFGFVYKQGKGWWRE